LGVVVLTAVGVRNVLQPSVPEPGLFGAFSYLAVGGLFATSLAAFVGLVVAGSLAADRRRGYPRMVLVRGISRTRYLLTKAAAMAAVAGLGTLLSCLATFVVAAFFLPWEPARGLASPDRLNMGPYPGLLEGHPLVNDLVLALLVSIGAGALALSGLAFGAVVANEFVAAAVPFALLVGGIYVFRAGSLLWLGPYTQLDLVGSYPYSLPQWAWPFTAPIYWGVFALLCVAVAALLTREDL
jgi:ABC-type transport system involved in multi-copper enzyme maturation permease subunit